MLSAATLLGAWEEASDRPLLWKALILLEAAYPERSAAEWAAEPVPRRDTLLLGLRTAVFGPRLECIVACPSCDERLEFGADAGELGFQVDPAPLLVAGADGYEAVLRLPSSLDLIRFMDADPDADAARRLLLACVERVSRKGEEVEAETLPDDVLTVIEQEMDRAGREATIEFALTCPACGHGWTSLFDIASYLWDEVDAWARRTFQEIHAIASVYGWSEREILRLSARRRRLYAGMVQ